MTRGNGGCNHEGRIDGVHEVPLHLARRTRIESSRSKDGRSRDLTVLKGGALHRSRPAPPPTFPEVRVILAMSAGLARAGLRSLLERQHDITVAGEASSGEQAVAMASAMCPDVVLMDISLPGLGGLAATRRILADPELPATKVVILTEDEREDLYGALRSGASGCVPLDTDPVELLRVVRVVADGGAQLSPSATYQLLEELASRPDPERSHPELFDELTTREREIVSLVALGLTNGEIAGRLVLSPATVKTHVSRAMRKLHISDRAKLVALAHQTGFVPPPPAADASVA
jgi:DNA-binding NarL/FixJ family response regulator